MQHKHGGDQHGCTIKLNSCEKQEKQAYHHKTQPMLYDHICRQVVIDQWFPNLSTRTPGGSRGVSRRYVDLLQNQNKTIISIMLCGHHLHSSERTRLIEQDNECVAVRVREGREEAPLIKTGCQ